VVLGLAAGRAWAELPPSAYIDMQQKAPEVVTLEILSSADQVMPERRGTRHRVRVEGRVIEVERSASGLKPDHQIRIEYTVFEPNEPIAGPSEPPILERGQKVPAFLKHDREAGLYKPAAGGYSFKRVEPPKESPQP